MQRFSTSPRESVATLWRHRGLVRAMVERDIVGRYRGSMMGIAWSFFNPVFMLLIYTFVFSVVFKARWGLGAEESKADFAIILFVGLIVHGLFAECVNRAPGLILGNVNYVKKVIFPLEILPWVAMGSALFHAAISIVVLVLAQLFLRHSLPWTAVFFPLVMVPLVFATMGLSWFLAALGVYIRDMGQVTSMFTTVMMFVSPVFYPVNTLSEQYRGWLQLNPLTYILEEGRNTLIFGQVPDFGEWLLALAFGMLIAWLGFAWFQGARKGFADVV